MKKVMSVAIALLTLICIDVNASSKVYYSNLNDVHFSEEEYDFISSFYGEGYQADMTLKEYEYIFADGVPTNIEKNEYIPFQMYSSSHSTASKSLSISKASISNYYLVSVTASWKTSPKVRSYDVIGAYIGSMSLVESPLTKVNSSEGTTFYSNLVTDTKGFGVSVKLPSSGSNISVIQTFKVTGSGMIYASYQHATSTISLANSKKYSISMSGYGNVFLFDNSVKNYYDQMGGVDISV